MSARNQHATVEASESGIAGNPWFYACPECGELPRSCICLRRSVRDRIANAIHFPFEPPEPTPFLVFHHPPMVEPPADGDVAAGR